MEGLVADSNRSIATLAITTLLKIGTYILTRVHSHIAVDCHSRSLPRPLNSAKHHLLSLHTLPLHFSSSPLLPSSPPPPPIVFLLSPSSSSLPISALITPYTHIHIPNPPSTTHRQWEFYWPFDEADLVLYGWDRRWVQDSSGEGHQGAVCQVPSQAQIHGTYAAASFTIHLCIHLLCIFYLLIQMFTSWCIFMYNCLSLLVFSSLSSTHIIPTISFISLSSLLLPILIYLSHHSHVNRVIE